jgi:UDP-N-acetylglucosamine 4-epimerase
MDYSKYTFLVTGGAGFIGSNIVNYLMHNKAKHVTVLDNLSTGYYENISEFVGLSNFTFIEGDIRDLDTCTSVINGINFISHQAALGSVPRSIENPIATNSVNVDGFLNILSAASKSNTLLKLIYAASSSTYGDSESLPKVEGKEGSPKSPYAVTKLVNELYADNFSKVFGLHTIGLRYFNVFGPKQSADNAYAAVIPRFMKCAINDEAPIIFGDGETSRDFTFIDNVVKANINCMEAALNNNYQELNQHIVFNIALGESTTLNQLWNNISEIAGLTATYPVYKKERIGDVKHSLASISKARKFINYIPEISIKDGLSITYKWYKQNLK